MAKQGIGDVAIGMANAPLPDGPALAAKPANRFSEWFGIVRFKAEPLRSPFMFPKGDAVEKQTAQYGLANVTFSKIEGVNFTATRIVKRVTPDGKSKVALVMPSVAVGPVRYPIINLAEASEKTQQEYLAFQDSVIDAFYVWRKAQRAAGHVDKAVGTLGRNERELTEADREEMGL